MKNLALKILLLLTAFPIGAQAYFSTMTTGDVLPENRYRVMAVPQVIVNKYDGFNIHGNFDMGLTDSSEIRGVIGFGEVDFQAGAFYKWIPVPDVGDQPALGVMGGLLIGRAGGKTELSLRVHPLISKKFETEIGDFTPYASIPFGMTTRDDETYFPVQIAGGTEWKTLNWENVRFLAEVGFNVHKSFSYIGAGIAIDFDNPNQTSATTSPTTAPATAPSSDGGTGAIPVQ